MPAMRNPHPHPHPRVHSGSKSAEEKRRLAKKQICARLTNRFGIVPRMLLGSLLVAVSTSFLTPLQISFPHPLLNVAWRPAMGAVAWGLLVHFGVWRETLMLSRLSRAQQRARRTQLATKAIFFFGVVYVHSAPQIMTTPEWRSLTVGPANEPELAAELAAKVSDRHVAPFLATPFVAVGAGMLMMPMALRETFVLNCIPGLALLLRVLRSMVSFTKHGDAFYFDKHFSCYEPGHSGFFSFHVFAMICVGTLADAPTWEIALSVVSVAMALVVRGEKRRREAKERCEEEMRRRDAKKRCDGNAVYSVL